MRMITVPILCLMLCMAAVCPVQADEGGDTAVVVGGAGAIATGVAIAIGR